MDRRQKKTRDAIFTAFSNLMKRKRYSQITIQQIIDEADIGRTTFYAHFQTKDDLLKAICDEIFSHVISNHLEKEITHDFSHSESMEAKITHLLYHLRENLDFLSGILVDESNDIFVNYFKEYLYGLFDGEINKIHNDIPEEYIINHVSSDLIETIRWWTKHNQYSPDEIAFFFLSTTSSLNTK